MNGLVGLGGTLAILVATGMIIGLADRAHFALRWLIVAAVLVAINDALLTNLYGLLPDLVGGTRNWQGKLLALAATLAIASSPAFGWHRSGFTLAQTSGSLKATLPVATIYCAFFVMLAVVFPGDPASGEEIAFQLTIPGLEEEPFYRGVLMLALSEAFTGKKHLFGVDWSWGAILSCILFGMAHAFGFSDGSFSFEPTVMALTAFPALFAVWLRMRTGSLLLPVLLHNFGNAFSLLA